MLTTCRCGRCAACMAEVVDAEINADYGVPVIRGPRPPRARRLPALVPAPTRRWEPWSENEIAELIASGFAQVAS